jgi:hypothetical protein
MQKVLGVLTILAGFLSGASPSMATTWQCKYTDSRESLTIVSQDNPAHETAGIQDCIQLKKRTSRDSRSGYVRECMYSGITGEAIFCYYTKLSPDIVGACLKGGGCPLDMNKWQFPR